ncbi:DUF6114 domain-containing protein [Streptomyces sp. NBC_00996]|uniref:DUF6114 domain-containing protein n=1 Tax=Streptomyces sp. NBC_00996 TaxID=2903710 RepID=UPI00386B130A|nr:DUF6114 domain-containing protein [Streptomyces sp. NBC_00996]
MINEPFGTRPGLRDRFDGTRRRFRTWRGGRPFWAGLFMFSAGAPIIYFPYVHITLEGVPVALSTTAGAASLIIGILLMTLGITLWFHQQVRVFVGVAGLLLTLVSFPLANFAGLFFGLFFGLVGGSLACAWVPSPSGAEVEHTAASAPVTSPGSEGPRGS